MLFRITQRHIDKARRVSCPIWEVDPFELAIAETLKTVEHRVRYDPSNKLIYVKSIPYRMPENLAKFVQHYHSCSSDTVEPIACSLPIRTTTLAEYSEKIRKQCQELEVPWDHELQGCIALLWDNAGDTQDVLSPIDFGLWSYYHYDLHRHNDWLDIGKKHFSDVMTTNMAIDFLQHVRDRNDGSTVYLAQNCGGEKLIEMLGLNVNAIIAGGEL
jgi:hypothetical protein